MWGIQWTNCCHQSESLGGECHSPRFDNVQSFSYLGLPDLSMSNLGCAYCMWHTYTKNYSVYLKFKFNKAFCILSGNSNYLNSNSKKIYFHSIFATKYMPLQLQLAKRGQKINAKIKSSKLGQ